MSAEGMLASRTVNGSVTADIFIDFLITQVVRDPLVFMY
jgi:hypothetical protein